MENNTTFDLQEVIFSSSDRKHTRQISLLEKDGKITKIAPRIYTSNFVDEASIIIKKNIFTIIGNLYPGALLSHRSAFEFKPTVSGQIFVSYRYTKKIKLPGITIQFLEGMPAIEGDNVLTGQLYVSQKERAFLENLETSRKSGNESKSISIEEIEKKLEAIIQINGEEGINKIRDKAKEISEIIGHKSEYEKLNKLISALLSTSPAKILTSPIAIARAFGHPYDASRISLFEKLFLALKNREFKDNIDRNTEENSFKNFAFFESYFSNYIEGTIFELDEAKTIISTDTPMLNRDEDSHDILGTYKIVSSKREMNITPNSANEFIDILKYRHKLLLSARTSKSPGLFKDKNNRAGETYFVDQKLVLGTLIKGFEFYNVLSNPFAKAAYIMFLISEVHPFLDGNGRIARVMMNAELVKARQTRIIIPTVFRDDYLGALRKLTRKEDPSAYIKMLQRAQEYSSTLDAENIDLLELKLQRSNAFREHDEANLIISID
jgi:Fic/DOC family